MPTLKETSELVENCSWKWTTYNGVEGQLATGPNGNSIFLPAAGARLGTSVGAVGHVGIYWSATQYEWRGGAYCLYIDSGGGHRDSGGNCNEGLTVRPVSD